MSVLWKLIIFARLLFVFYRVNLSSSCFGCLRTQSLYMWPTACPAINLLASMVIWAPICYILGDSTITLGLHTNTVLSFLSLFLFFISRVSRKSCLYSSLGLREKNLAFRKRTSLLTFSIPRWVQHFHLAVRTMSAASCLCIWRAPRRETLQLWKLSRWVQRALMLPDWTLIRWRYQIVSSQYFHNNL